MRSILLICVHALVLSLSVALLSSSVSGQAVVWDHFTYDVDVTTAAIGPNAVGNGNPGPTVVSTNPTPRWGNGSALNTSPNKGGFVTITYDRQDSWSWSIWLWLAESIPQTTVVLEAEIKGEGEFLFQLTASQTLQFQYLNTQITDFNDYIIPVNTWTHFVVTGDASTGNTIISEYVNAEFRLDYSVNSVSPSGSKQYKVLESGGYNQDELWIFNSALTLPEVTSLFKSNTVS